MDFDLQSFLEASATPHPYHHPSLPHLLLDHKSPSGQTQSHLDHSIQPTRKGKPVGGRSKPKDLRRQLVELQDRVHELQQENQRLRLSQHECQRCRHRRPEFYVNEATETRMEDEADGIGSPRNQSADSIEFEKADLHLPLLNAAEMEGKMWIFLGLTLLAMGSRASEDGALHNFKVLNGVGVQLGQQLKRGEKQISLDVFCSQSELENVNFIDGMNFDPFYAEDYGQGLQLDKIRVEAVHKHGLCYDSKYRYSINYEALLTIMEYAKDYCIVS